MKIPSLPRLRIDFYRPGDLIAAMRCWLLLALAGVVGVTGCAHKEYGTLHQPFNPLPPTAAAPTPTLSKPPIIVTPETGLTGKVVKVNPSGRFVVLNFPVGHLPAVDQRMNIYHQGLKVAEVKVSGPQLEDNVVGDLLSGSAQVGDEVRDQ